MKFSLFVHMERSDLAKSHRELFEELEELALTAEVAAAQLDAAFRQTHIRRVYLCPLDGAGDLPTLAFGPSSIQRPKRPRSTHWLIPPA